jgi:molybdopterin-guanine dinucleotide biosynthesis protein A
MGQDKAQLLLGGETMLARQVRLLRKVSSRVAVIGPPAEYADCGAPVFPDAILDRGPLGGIYTGLLQARTEWSLFLSCDLPFVNARFLRYLCARALACDADVVVPRSREGELQTVVAVFRRRALRLIRARLESGDNAVFRALGRLRTRVLPWPELARAGFSARVFDNMNTPADYAEAVRRIEFNGPGTIR